MRKPLLFFSTAMLLAVHVIAQTTLIPYGSSWKYLDDGSNQGTAWRGHAYDDATWKSGIGKFGYGGTSVVTRVSYGPNASNKYITTYFRKTISITNPAEYSLYTGNVYREDGIVVYVNGTEVYRNNMPGGSVIYTTLAFSASDNGTVQQPFTIPGSAFTTGSNVIAVEIHQNRANSGDLAFDMQLAAQRNGGPLNQGLPSVISINRQSPTAETTNASTVYYRVVFSEKVTGVNASDFVRTTVSGNASGSISSSGVTAIGSDGTTYDVRINSISGSGVIRLDLKPSGTGIVNEAGNAIGGGFTTGQTYTIDKTAPLVTGINRESPTTQTVSATAVKYRVFFSERVTGVNATDFSLAAVSGNVSGALATDAATPVGSDGTTYDVTVSAITGTGTLRLNLKSSGTGIQDEATNGISGGFTSGQTYIVTAGTPLPPGGATTLTRGPYLQMANQSAVTLRWRTDVAADSKIEVGTSHGAYVFSATNPIVTTDHDVRINGLSAGTKYFYRFGSSNQILQSGIDNYFVTAPATNSTGKIRIAAFGDCGKNSNGNQTGSLNAYLNYVSSNPAELMILLGDNAYEDGTDAEYQQRFFIPYSTTLLKNHILFPSPGNHDYGASGQASRSGAYYQNFTMPTAAECGGVPSGTESYYSYDWGNVHFISMDSYGTESANNLRLYDTTGPQVTWVKQDLAANTKPWVIVYWHHPPFTKGSHNSDSEGELIRIRQNFIRILERHGVDLILNGHSHDYERSYLLNNYYGTEAEFNAAVHTKSNSSGKNDGSVNSAPYMTETGAANHGTVYVVSGSSGQSGSVKTGYPHDALPFAFNDGGMFYVEVEGNRLDGKFIRKDGVVTDNFTIIQNGAIQNSAARRKTVTFEKEAGSSANELVLFPTVIKRGAGVTVTTKSKAVTEIVVTDMNGRIISSARFSGTTQLKTANLLVGTYFVRVITKGQVQTKRFVVTK